jgi:DNA processing protein
MGDGRTVALAELVNDAAVLLTVSERLAPSMNGSSARRLSVVLDGVRLDPSGQKLDPHDLGWVTSALPSPSDARLDHWRAEVERLAADGVAVVSCADDGYPENLAVVHDGPPVLFVRGSILDDDTRSVAVVGTRQATTAGVELATTLARELASSGVTIISGLAKGIDTAAHAAALNGGGRTIAVFGTTIDRVYPAENQGLARRIPRSGACVSQFLPGRRTGPWSFPVRNVTASGLSLGTIVVEASETSGARLLAEAAVAHGKRVFLVEQLVTRQSWAREMADTEPLVTVAPDAGPILEALDSELAIPSGLLL